MTSKVKLLHAAIELQKTIYMDGECIYPISLEEGTLFYYSGDQQSVVNIDNHEFGEG